MSRTDNDSAQPILSWYTETRYMDTKTTDVLTPEQVQELDTKTVDVLTPEQVQELIETSMRWKGELRTMMANQSVIDLKRVWGSRD